MEIDPKALEAAMQDVKRFRFRTDSTIDDFVFMTAQAAITAYLHAREAQGYVEVEAGERCEYQHKKRGTIYRTLVVGELQWSGNEQFEGMEIVAYAGKDGKVWMRPLSEFHDGRFECLAGRRQKEG
jgi:hypothetical protein